MLILGIMVLPSGVGTVGITIGGIHIMTHSIHLVHGQVITGIIGITGGMVAHIITLIITDGMTTDISHTTMGLISTIILHTIV